MKKHEKRRGSGADEIFEHGLTILQKDLTRRLNRTLGKFTGRATSTLKELHERLQKLE